MIIPTPTIERISRTIDGCTWYAWHIMADGSVLGASSRTKRDLIPVFEAQWLRFSGTQ